MSCVGVYLLGTKDAVEAVAMLSVAQPAKVQPDFWQSAEGVATGKSISSPSKQAIDAVAQVPFPGLKVTV